MTFLVEEIDEIESVLRQQVCEEEDVEEENPEKQEITTKVIVPGIGKILNKLLKIHIAVCKITS